MEVSFWSFGPLWSFSKENKFWKSENPKVHLPRQVKGGGVPPNSVKEKFRQKMAIFGQTLISALFDPFFRIFLCKMIIR